MYTPNRVDARSRSSIADFVAAGFFALILLALTVPAAAQSYNPKVDLSLTKSVDRPYASVGEDVIYTITVSNTPFYGSASKATNIVVKDYLPDGLTALAYSATTGGENGITFDSYSLTWTIEWLNAGQSVDLQFKARVNREGEFKNCAEIWDADQQDIDSKTGAESYGPLAGLASGEDDEDCVEFWGVSTGSISGMVFDDSDGNGLFDNYEVGLADFEVDLREIGADYTCGTYDDVKIRYTYVDSQGNYTFPDVPAGTYCLEIDDHSIPSGFQATTASPVKVTVAAGENVTDIKFGFVMARIDLELTKVVDNENPTVGDKVTFTLTLTNNQVDRYGQIVPTATATGVQVTDYLPQGLSFLAASSSNYASFDESTLTWTIDQLQAGKSVSLVLEATVHSDGELTNCTEVWDAHQRDRDSRTGEEAYGELVGGPDAEDDQDCAALWAAPRTIDLELTKVVDNSYPAVGDKVRFTITLTNNDEYRTVETATATGIQVKDYLPQGLTLHSSEAPYGTTFDESTTTWHIDELGPGKSLSLVLKVVVDKDGEFTNCAEVWDANEIDRDSKTGAEAYGELVGGPSAEDDQDCASLWVNPGSTPPPSGKGSVTGVVFDDLDYDGDLDSGEPGLFGFEVDLVTMGGDYRCGGGDDIEIATTDTDNYGAYSFWDVEAGTYCVRILDAAIPYGYSRTSPDPVQVEVTSYGSVEVNFGFKSAYTPPPPPPSGDTLCYLVADNDGAGYDSADVLTSLSQGSYGETIIGKTRTQMIEAIAYNPWVQKLFASNAKELGTLDTYTGKFSSIGRYGGGEGEEGWIEFLDVDGLSFNPYSKVLFGSVRRTGKRDLLIQIDPVTGKSVKDAFGYGVDYQVIKPEAGHYHGPELDDIDDLAIDPESGQLYAINNRDGMDSRLVIIDPATGWITKVLELPVGNVEGLAFFNNGTLYGTAGEGEEAIVIIDKQSLQVTVQTNIGIDGNRDYESIDCLTAAPSYLRVAAFDDVNGDGLMQSTEASNSGMSVALYRDMDEDGLVSSTDMLLGTTTVGQDGMASFTAAATGAFVMQVGDPAGSPVMLPAVVNGFGVQFEVTTYGGLALATANETEGDVPQGFELSGNYPNPFNPETTIGFSIAESGKVRLSVHDVLGREVAVLVDGAISAGQHSVNFQAGSLPSGTYVTRLAGTTGVQTRTMVLLK